MNFDDGSVYSLKVAPGGWVKGAKLITIKIQLVKGRLWLKFGYSKPMIAEVKSMSGPRWHGFDEPNPVKMWSVAHNHRNLFTLEYLSGGNPYAKYLTPLLPCPDSMRPLLPHQKLGISHMITRGTAGNAADMGLGKSLMAIEACEYHSVENDIPPTPANYWYVGPCAGVIAFDLEIEKWGSGVQYKMMTYEGLVKLIKNWPDGLPAPLGVVFDESSKLKNHAAQRSQAAAHLAKSMRNEHGASRIMVIELSGTPQPKSPVDWWHQAEILCPGYLKEGHPGTFKKRLCITEERQSAAGGMYPHLITWLDDENKCAVCGQPERDAKGQILGVHAKMLPYPDDGALSTEAMHRLGYHQDQESSLWFKPNLEYHAFKKSVNEVSRLYDRLRGLILVQETKDCVDLPVRIDSIIKVTPTPDMVRGAKLIATTSTRAVEALVRMRELADGFQYTDVEAPDSPIVCDHCNGLGCVTAPVPVEDQKPVTTDDIDSGDYLDGKIVCPVCRGTREVKKMMRVAKEVPTPKDKVLRDELELNEDVGRMIVWAGFTASIDRVVKIAKNEGWAVLRVDGRGHRAETHGGLLLDSAELLRAMDYTAPDHEVLLEKYPRVCFVAHPKSGGMALTLHAAAVALVYSLDFDGEGFMQSIKRHHRVGMCATRPAQLKVIHCLSVDKMVHDNLLLKVNLQKLSMGELQRQLEKE